MAVLAIFRAMYWFSSSLSFWGLIEKKKKKEAISTAELLQRFWTCFQGNWRLCGSVVEAVQRPLWVDWFSCLFGPYNWLGRTQAHVHSHTNTINVSLKRRHKRKKSLLYRKQRGSDWLIVLRNTRVSVLTGFPVLHRHHSPCIWPLYWTTGTVGNTGSWRIKVMLLRKKLSWGGATGMDAKQNTGLAVTIDVN